MALCLIYETKVRGVWGSNLTDAGLCLDSLPIILVYTGTQEVLGLSQHH